MTAQRSKEQAIEKAKNIKLLVHDVPGVLTDGTFYYNEDGKRSRAFWHRDGFGAISTKMSGVEVAIVTSESDAKDTQRRMQELKIQRYYETPNKMAKIDELEQELGITDENVCYIGSQVTEIGIMKRVGFAVAPADAMPQVKEVADYVTEMGGGKGVIREIGEFIIRAHGKWQAVADQVAKMGYK